MIEKQKVICKKYKTDFVECSAELKCGVALQTIGKQPIYGVRYPIENGTTGWYIYCGEYSSDDNFYQPVHTIHLNDELPDVLPYLGLPPGWSFIIDDKGYEDVWFDPQFINS